MGAAQESAVIMTISNSAMQRVSGRYLLIGKSGNPRAFTGMFNSDSADTPVAVQVNQRIFIEVARLHNIGGAKLDIECVGVLEVLDFHTK